MYIRRCFSAPLARPVAAALLTIGTTIIAAPAIAGPIPSPGAEATASARSVGNDAGTNVSQGAVNALISNSVSEPDEAFARARATAGGAVGSESRTDATSGDGSTEAGSTASWVAQFTTGGANPGRSVDIDFGLTVDGSLQVGNNNSGAGLNDVFAAVGVSLRAIGASGTTSIFDGDARLFVVARDQTPQLTRSGDWAAADRAGDFSFPDEPFGPCDPFGCLVDVVANIELDDALLVDFSDVFAIELTLTTDAFAFDGSEVSAKADFFNTANVALSTSTPGVTISQLQAPAPVAVAEPGTLALMASGLAGLALLRRRRRSAVGRV